jgi:hypothetical protein
MKDTQRSLANTEAFVRRLLTKTMKQKPTDKTVREVALKFYKAMPKSSAARNHSASAKDAMSVSSHT